MRQIKKDRRSVSKAAMSVMLTSSMLLNSGYALAADTPTDNTAEQKVSVSEKKKTTVSVAKADKIAKKQSDTAEETSIYDFEYKLSDNDDVIITKYIGSGTEVVIPEDFNGYVVTEIADNAFRSTSVTSVTLSSSVEKIGNYAFYSAASLQTVNLRNQLKSIGEYAFYACYALTSVTIPDSCKTIGSDAFGHAEKLETLNLGNGVETIGNYAFANCKKLQSITIPDSVTSLGSCVFNYCTANKEIHIGKGLKSLPRCAFGSNYEVTDVTLPDNIEIIGNAAFGSCSKLKNIQWSANLTTIDDYAFEYDTALTDFTVPDTVTQIGTDALRYCTALETITLGKNVQIKNTDNFTTGDTALTTFSVHKDNPYYSNDEQGALFNKDKTTLIRVGRGYEGSYTVPDSVTVIGSYAFSYCQKLESITVGKNVAQINAYAFQYCDKITQLIFPDTLKAIGYQAFGSCTALTRIGLGKSLETVGDYAFYNCSKLTSVTLPDTCTTIGQYAFRNCTALANVDLGEGLVTIKYEAFWYCRALKNITLPDSLKTIETYAFEYTGLESIAIPDSVENMGTNVFYNCNSLKSVTLGKGLTSIPNTSFCNCTALETVEFPENIQQIGNSAFSGCTALKTVDFQEGLTVIGSYAFQGCTALQSVTFPESLTQIGSYAFNGCSKFTEITLPDNVVTVGDHAFYQCTALESVSIGAKTSTLSASAFYGDNALKQIEVSQDNQTFAAVDGVLFDKAVTKILIFPRAKEGSYTIPDTVTAVSNNAFDTATGITEVIFGNAVASVGKEAFLGCNALTKIKINNNCETIGESAFKGCSALQSVTLGKNTKTLGNYCFYNCSSLTEVELGESLEVIPYCCFENCKVLKTVAIPDSVKTIGQYAFEYCYALEEVDFGNGVQTIEYEAFYRTNLQTVTLPDSLTKLGNNVFAYAPVKTIHFGKGIETIATEYLMMDTMETVTVSEENEKLTAVDNVLYDKDMTKLIFCVRNKTGEFVIPSTVTSLGTYAFYNCKSLTSIKEYGSVLSMDNYAIDNLEKSSFTAYVIENSYLHKNFQSKGYTCETIEDTRTQIGDCDITYDRYVLYAYRVRPNLTVSYQGVPLEENKDYKAYYSNNSYNIGDATITIYGMGEYGGNTSKVFTIFYQLTSTFTATRTGAGTYTFKTTASEGVPDYLYSFEYTPKENANDENAVWQSIPNPENLSTLSYFFEEDGEFTVRAIVSDKAGNRVVKQQNVEVTAPRAQLTASNDKPLYGETITLTGYGTNFGKNRQYKFDYKDDDHDWTVIQDFSTERETAFTFNSSGTVQVRLTITDENGNTAKKMLSFSIEKPELEISTDKTPVLNEAFNIVADIKKLTDAYSYQYQYRKSNASSWTTLKNFTSATKCPLTLTATGNYQIRVVARYNKDTTVKMSKVKTVTVKKPELTLSVTETANLNEVVSLNAQALNFGEGINYKYQYKSVSDTQWKNLYSGTKTRADLELTQTGNYTVRVIATDTAGNKVTETKTISVAGALLELKVSSARVYVGDDIQLSAVFKNFKTDYAEHTYKFEYRECLSSTWHTLQDYSSESTATFTTRHCATSDQYANYAGMFEMRVTAKDKNGVTSVANTEIFVDKMKLEFSISEANVVPNTEVTLSANVTGGAKPVKFMYEFKKDNGDWQPLVYSNYTENKVLTFKFSAEGTYQIRVSAKDNNGLVIGNNTNSGGVGYEGSYVVLKVANPVVHTLEGNLSYRKVNDEYQFTANARYSTGTPKYRFTVKSSFDSTETVFQDFSTENTAAINLTQEGTYTVTVYITDDTGKTVQAQLRFTVYDYRVDISREKPQTTAGRELKVNALVYYGAANDTYTYKYEYKLKGQSDWQTASDFSENTEYAYKFFTAGVYDIRVTAKNSSGIEKSAVSSVTINPKIACVISAMPDHIGTDTDTILVCNASGGTGRITYQYEYCLSGSGEWKAFENGGAVTLFSADTAGVYKIRATATDEVGSTRRTEFVKVYVQ